MERVIVIGTSCSGKTTFASKLAQILNYPHIQIDEHHWLDGWVERPAKELREIVQGYVSQSNWVLDGNYSKLRDITWKNATTIIWLNYSFPVVFNRAFKRTIKRVFFKEKLYSGNREILKRAFFSKDSILLWVLKTYWRRKKRYRSIFETLSFNKMEMIEFSTPKAAQTYLDKLDMS